MNNTRIEGVIRLTTALHCASPDRSLAEADNDTPTVQQTIQTVNGQQRIPYFPGNDLRGRLRRKAAKIVLDQLLLNGSKVTPQLYAGLNAGANSAQPDSSPDTIEEVLRARQNVYMGLFGGGARLLRSRFSANDLVPILADTVALNIVPAQYVENDGQNFLPVRNTATGQKATEGWQLIQRTQVLRVDDVTRVLSPTDMERYIENAAAVVAEIQATNLAAKVARKASKADAEAGKISARDVTKKIDIGNIATFQSIIAGTPLFTKIGFADDASDAHVGLLLLSLRDLVADQALGGWSRIGLGQYTANLSLHKNGEVLPVFTSQVASAEAVLSDAVAPYVEAARNAVSKLTVDAMAAFFENRAKAEA